MSDLVEALKDTHHLIEVLSESKNLCTLVADSAVSRAARLTDRIIEASRQAGAVVDRCLVDRSAKAMTFALIELEGMPADIRTVAIDRAIRHLKDGLKGGA